MKTYLQNKGGYTISWGAFILASFLTLTSCTGSKQIATTDYHKLARASIVLGIDIERNDNHKLFLEAAQWIGVPYRYGGRTKYGIDCSGLTCNIYQEVFSRTLSRNSNDQYSHDITHKIRKGKLMSGDLVFFNTLKSRKKINHVGIYLKDGKFIHASTSKGVRIDCVDDTYWKKCWISGGRL